MTTELNSLRTERHESVVSKHPCAAVLVGRTKGSVLVAISIPVGMRSPATSYVVMAASLVYLMSHKGHITSAAIHSLSGT